MQHVKAGLAAVKKRTPVTADDHAEHVAALEEWFNNSMDRVSGWYKRRMQLVAILVGAGVAILTNADTLQIVSVRKDVPDGAFVDAKILDLQNHELVGESRRMAVVKGTRPATVIGAAPVGTHIHVLAIPRIDLDRVIRKVSPGHKDVVPGAYEMIIPTVIE